MKMGLLRMNVTMVCVAVGLLLLFVKVNSKEGILDHSGILYLLHQEDQRIPPSGEEPLMQSTLHLTTSATSGKV